MEQKEQQRLLVNIWFKSYLFFTSGNWSRRKWSRLIDLSAYSRTLNNGTRTLFL